MSEAKIIADRGEGWLLIDMGGGTGCVWNKTTGEVFQPRLIDSILARGYWEDYEGPQDLPELPPVHPPPPDMADGQ